MKMYLFSPPIGCITQPYLSLPSLTGFLRSIGHKVVQCDIGIRTIDEMLTPTHLQGLYESILEQKEHLYSARKLTEQGRKHWYALLLADLCAPDVIANIERAKAILRSKDLFCQVDAYIYASNIVRRALEIVSAAYFPTKVSYNKCDFRTLYNFDNIYNLTFNEARNPFLRIMRDVVLPQVLREIPPLVGISVAYNSQIVPGYTLAFLIKSLAPTTHIVVGGATITSAEKRIRANSRAFEWVDSYVFGEGESALAHLIKIIESGFSIRSKFNKLYLNVDRSSNRTQVITIENRSERDHFDELPSPDYSGLNLGDYLSPETVFLVSSSRGCYYGKCTFCNVSLSFKNQCQQRSPDRVRKDIESLQNKHGARFFFFADDCVAPKRCREISDFAPKLDIPIYWQTEVRYEKGFTKELLKHMYQGGCRQLIVGNESGSQRVLDLMRKNTNIERNKEIIRNVAEAGIAIHLSNFFGFPSETTDEEQDTINFLISLRDYITSCALVTFKVMEFSLVYRNPLDFGVTRMRRRNVAEFVPHFVFSTCSGATRKDVRKSYGMALIQLKWAYPCQDRFLDGVCAAHVLLYLAFFSERKLENIFLDVPPINDLSKAKPQLRTSVKSRQLGRTTTVLYNSESGCLMKLSTAECKWLGLTDGNLSLTEIVAKSYKNDLKDGPGGAVGNTAALLLSAYDLYQAGFLDLN